MSYLSWLSERMQHKDKGLILNYAWETFKESMDREWSSLRLRSFGHGLIRAVGEKTTGCNSLMQLAWVSHSAINPELQQSCSARCAESDEGACNSGVPHRKDVLMEHLSDTVIYQGSRRLSVACKLPCAGGPLSGYCNAHCTPSFERRAQTQPRSDRTIRA